MQAKGVCTKCRSYRKQLAIEEEDYDAAKSIKADIAQIRSSRRVVGSPRQATAQSVPSPIRNMQPLAESIQLPGKGRSMTCSSDASDYGNIPSSTLILQSIFCNRHETGNFFLSCVIKGEFFTNEIASRAN